MTGTILGPSVQASHIYGGVHFHSAPGERRITPRQVAPPPQSFAGRRIELATLHRLAATSGPALVVLSGPGGVGKTALARRWAYETGDRFADGKLFVDLSGFSSTPPLDPRDALTWFLRAFGLSSADVPEELAEQVALFRSHTAGRALLMIIDNAHSAAQVRVLLPASTTSMTIVTSRRRLAGLVSDGATLVDVSPLPAGDSMTLLANAVGPARINQERDQAERLADLCAGLPIALCIAAARLSARPRLTLARIVNDLTSETSRLAQLATPQDASLQGTFEWSYRLLSTAAATFYRRLSLHPGEEFGPGPVTALMPAIQATTPSAEAAELIDVLLEANLLQEVTEERFRFHDLIRLHARQKADTDDSASVRDNASIALMEWYLAASGVADMAITPYRRRLSYAYVTAPGGLPILTGRDEALAWLDRELPNLLAAAQEAMDHGWPELSWHLSDVLWPLLLYRKVHERKEIDSRGVAAARMWGNDWAEGRMLKRLGRTCTTLGDYVTAEQHLRAAVLCCDRAGDVDGGVEVQEMLALLYRDSGRETAAVSLLAEVLTARRLLGDNRSVGLTLINTGTLLSQLGRAGDAIELLLEAGTLLDALADIDPYNGLRVKIALSDAYLAVGDIVRAEEAAVVANEGMRAVGSAFGQAEALNLLGRTAERRGDVDQGRRHFQQALDIFESLGSGHADGLRRKLAELRMPAAPPEIQEIGDCSQ